MEELAPIPELIPDLGTVEAETDITIISNENADRRRRAGEEKQALIAEIMGKSRQLGFDFNSTSVKESSAGLLQDLSQLLQKDESLSIVLIGHTDNVGSEQVNQEISQERAESVKQALVQRGIDRSRIKAVGRGETRPLNDNATAAQRKENRRVEWVVY